MTIRQTLTVLFSLALTAVFTGCPSPDKGMSYLERALAAAGPNRAELEKVLARYAANPEDSLKYRAAVFLIENMPGHTYYRGKQLDNYLEYYAILPEAISSGRGSAAAVDTIRTRYGALDLSSLEHLSDIGTVDSAYLCSNIDWAFKVWEEQPWCRNVSFGDFCEYILPYRVGNETLAEWREDYYAEYNGVLDSLRSSPGKDDPLQAAQVIASYIDRTVDCSFTMDAPASLPNIGPEAVKYHSGSCREFTDYVLYVCRAVGIPCAMDYMPVRGNENAGHSWTVFWDIDGTAYYRDNDGPAMRIEGSNLYNTPKAKVVRRMYSRDREMERAAAGLPDGAETGILADAGVMDVTRLYSNSFIDTLSLHGDMLYKGRLPEVVYLCLNYGMGWSPVDWAVPRGGKVEFHGLNGRNILRVLSYEDGQNRYWTDPFYLPRDGEILPFRADGETADVTVFSKYPPAFFNIRMPGGVFEGSNEPDFNRRDTLQMIYDKPLRLYTAVTVTDTAAYRYVRYYGPRNGYCNVSEISFYDDGGQRLEGIPFGTLGGSDDRHGYASAFDGSTLTSVDYIEPEGCWVGLDFGRPVRLSKIVYSPRNYDNYVREGNRYELFYCDKVWKSAGTVTAASDSILFSDVPEGVLYLLKNHSGGVQERAFAYRDGRQYWDTECEELLPEKLLGDSLCPAVARTASEQAWTGRYTFRYPGEGWEEPDYDDSGWREGRAAFGTAGQRTAHTPFLVRDIWVRRQVEFNPGDIAGRKLILRYSYDDCLVVYINGIKVVEVSGWDTDAEQEIPDAVKATMRDGKAVIAARGRNLDGEGIVDFGIYVAEQ